MSLIVPPPMRPKVDFLLKKTREEGLDFRLFKGLVDPWDQARWWRSLWLYWFSNVDSTMILIELNGERQLVLSLDGYEGATVIKEGVDEQPSDFHKLDDKGAWVLDEDAEHEGLMAAANSDVDARIEFLEHRLAEMEATMQVMVPMVEQASGVNLETGEALPKEG